MGKKSKKKSRPSQGQQRERLNTDNTTSDSSSQQELQQQQQDQPQLPRQPQQNHQNCYGEPQQPPPAVALRNSKRGYWENCIEVYDRVWYIDSGGSDDSNDQGTYQRGIVRSKSELDDSQNISNSNDDGDDDDTETSNTVEYRILPVDAPDEPERLIIRHSEDQLRKDHFNWELRFHEGDKVVCHVRLKEEQPQQFWVPATVTQLWATDANQLAVWPYLCTLDKPAQRHASARYFRHLICDDNDQCIILRNSIFRFALGSNVVFNSKWALYVGMRPDPESIPKWVAGTICKVECLGNAQIYAAYKCSFVVNNKLEYCLIHIDDDEHVADPETTPRQRLLDAIEQSCSFAHIDYLIQEAKLDVSSFQELLINKAIRHGNYDALLWFQENANVNLETLRDVEGNGLLHQILRGKGATEFFIKMARYYSQQRSIKIDFGFSGLNKKRGLAQSNNLGQTVLHSIVAEDDMQVLSAAFATRLDRILGLSYFYGPTGSDGLSELRDAALANGNQIMAKMVQELDCYRALFHLKQTLLYGRVESFDSLLVNFGQEPKPSVARRLARMLREEKEITRSVYTLTQKLIIGGEQRALVWLFEADPELMKILSWRIRPTVDAHEFAQPELFQQFSAEREKSSVENNVDMVSLAAHGAPMNISLDEESSAMYANLLDSFIGGTNSKVRHLAMYLEILLAQSHDRSFKDLVGYKLRLLRDDDSLPNRLEILNYLVRDHGVEKPNAVDAIRWRQGGVLRWLVKESLIDLKEPAVDNKHIRERRNLTTFLGSQEPPTPSMSTGEFLCFAAVEFDDLQTIQWLTDTQRLPVKSFICNGWNLMHVCAFYGRTEIAHWLVSGSHLKPLVRAVSRRKQWDMRYSTHLALERGFTYLTTLLVSWGCPTEDTKGRSLESIAKNSSFPHVVKWGNEKDKPIVLKTDVQELLRLLSLGTVNFEAVKQHITGTKCLDFEKWEECNYHNAEAPGPSGLSFINVVETCCLSRNKEFTIWLCTVVLCPKEKLIEDFWGPHNNGWEAVDEEVDWILIFRLMDDKMVLVLQESPWREEIVCTDPAMRYPLKKLSDIFNDDQVIMQHLFEAAHEIIRRDVLEEFIKRGLKYIHRLLTRGESVSAISDSLEAIASAASAFREYDDVCLLSYFDGSSVTVDGHVNVDGRLSCKYRGQNPLRWQMLWRSGATTETKLVYLVLAAEGYEDLFLWSLDSGKGWNAEKERVATRIAAYRGYGKIVNVFLERQYAAEFHSARSARFYAAILGAAESGRIDDLEAYVAELGKHDKPLDPILDFDFSRYEGECCNQSPSNVAIAMASSLIIAAIYGCISDSKDPRLPEAVSLPSPRGYALLRWVAQKSRFDSQRFLKFFAFLLDRVAEWGQLERGIYVARYLSEEMGLNAWACQGDIGRITKRYMSAASRDKKDPSRGVKLMIDWLNVVSSLGLEIQSIAYEDFFGDEDKIYTETLAELQAVQRKQLSRFYVIKHGGPLDEIQDGVQDGSINLGWHDCHGLQLVHLSAAYDRLDVLQWLIEAKHATVSDKDGSGRNVLQVALDSNAVACIEWTRRRKAAETISAFISSRYSCRIDMKHKHMKLRLVGLIQAWSRGYSARRLFGDHFVTRLEASQRFKAIWEDATCMLNGRELVSWTDLKQKRYNIAQAAGHLQEEELYDTIEVLGQAGKRVLVEPKKQVDFQVDVPMKDGIYQSKEVALPPRKTNGSNSAHFAEILLTKDVVKWLRVGDSKYREFFARRMEQLAGGDRSRTLAKRLSGCKSLIYETYLEQKSGFRILWTETKDGALLIWYVAKHKAVSRLLDLIGDSRSRSSRTPMGVAEILDSGSCDEESGVLDDSQLLLDPRGDTPLKLYSVPTDDIEKLGDSNWEPPLHLTHEEKEIVETEGTVLVLGRSGTGKTICICNRMDFDRHKANKKAVLSQLFVARSSRLCNYVKDAVESSDIEDAPAPGRQFTTFYRLIQSLENIIPRTGRIETLFLPSQRVDFLRFKREVWKPTLPVDALIAWTSIRSFIKGSIEAVQNQRPLTIEEYLKIGKKRCRLVADQRKHVYALFEKYNRYCTECGLWDNCDRISSLLAGLDGMQGAASMNPNQTPHYDKIYVDEVQDYTQAEIALFFKLCDPGGLFLAGDPAQSVVEGVEFRFEDIRSVGHHLYEANRELIPDKPRTVNTNFRSHSGVLNVAAAILDKLFGAFPDAAKHLEKDRGLFTGPRPCVLQKVDFACLTEVISKMDGVVILTHDEGTASVKQQLGYPLVYGIREAKGLEFDSVILLDFFRRSPSQTQKWFRDLFLGREVHEISDGCPELESSLKLLYTAATRCIQRLVFAETSNSISGDAFARWITSIEVDQRGSALAVRQTVDNYEKVSYSPDEWVSIGLKNAMAAESTSDASEAESWLEKALYCFDQAGESSLSRRARTHKASARFRSELRTLVQNGHVADESLEFQSARFVEQLISQDLDVEAKRVIESILPHLTEETQSILKERLLSKLPVREDSV